MKRVVSLTGIFILLLVFSVLIVGCKFAGLSMPEKHQTVKDLQSQDQAVAEKEVAQAVVETQPVTETQPAAVTTPVVGEEMQILDSLNNSENMTMSAVEKEFEISGSAERLQSNLELCPHLAREFDCDRYDVRGCNFHQRIGENGFYPQFMRCRSGEVGAGERHDSQYCFIQECSPIVVEGIAEKFGGYVAYAEYDYKLEKTGTGIMTYWNLRSCGEEIKEFDSEFDCQTYYSEWRKLWD